MTDQTVSGFFAYPSKPVSCGDAIRQAVDVLNGYGIVSIRTWEQCQVGGKLVIFELCKAIDQSQLFCADVTDMNANVMFELGYAIARKKRIWLILDPTIVESKSQFEQLRILTTVGYARYSSSSEIVNRFTQDHPDSDLQSTLYAQAIERNLPSVAPIKVLYLKSLHATDASIQITNSVANLERLGVPLIVDDPKESTTQSLTWYGTQVYSSTAVICHLTGPNRIGARLQNARYALVSGLAFGMGKSLLMLSEGEFLAPIDYRDLLLQYETANEAAMHLAAWKADIEFDIDQKKKIKYEHATHERLATELKGLRVGEYIAENEAGRLVEDYFVETSAYRDALEGNQVVFVGRKGTGKTANFLKLSSELAKGNQSLVCVIKPNAYELHGVLDLLMRYKGRDTKGYAVESLWKFLILTEVAIAAVNSISNLSSDRLSLEEEKLLDFMNREGAKLKGEFAIRLERCLASLVVSQGEEAGTEASHLGISEALHQSEIHDLRLLLGAALSSKKRVSILIDNLDKPWDKRSDLDTLAQFLLGLLGAANRLSMDFKRADSRRRSVNLTLAIFLRSDIFDKLRAVASEPDKIPYSKLQWGDREILMRVIEERFVASHEGTVRPDEIWERYFCKTVGGLPTKDYFATRILPRPRDLVFFVKAAMATAVNRNHILVTEEDIRESEKQYSQFAFGSILVEVSAMEERIEDILYEFVGSSPILTEDEIVSRLSKIGVSDMPRLLQLLCSVTFLGLETRKNHFRYVEDPQEYRKALSLAQQVGRHDRRGLRFQIHYAFWAFLEVRKA
jgi:hypothetical protein